MASTVGTVSTLNFLPVSHLKKSSSSSSDAGGGTKPKKISNLHQRSCIEEMKSTNKEKLMKKENVINGKEAYELKTKSDHNGGDQMQSSRWNMKDYVEQTKDLIVNPDGGPPRWISPLDCGVRWSDSPLLLYLPGLDGVGLGLISQHQRLGKVFDIWCLHIPVKDRTPFKELVELVEVTVKTESFRSPNRPIYLVGESIGGCLALAVAASNPTIDLTLILANTATSYRKSPLPYLVPFLEAIPEQFDTIFPYLVVPFTGNPLRMTRTLGQRDLPFLSQNVEELLENLSSLLTPISVLADILPRDSLLWKLKLLESASSFANSCIHDVKAQTLILASGKDQLLPSLEEAERLYKTLPTCQIRKFHDSGHSLFMEDGFDLVTVIKGAALYRRKRNFDYVSDFIIPTPSEMELEYARFRWLDVAVDPVLFSTLENGDMVRGLAGIPHEGPVVLVGYHMLFGLDLFPTMSNFLMKENIFLKGLAHPVLFQKEFECHLPDPSLFDSFRILGGVPVSASNFFKLLATKSHVLLYPGGIREALHRKGEENKLFWPSESEFVRVAARFGAKIVPFGVVGSDDLLDVVLDYDDFMRIPFFNAFIKELNDSVFTRLRTDAEGEVAEQDMHAPAVSLKLPGRFYYIFGKPIETEGRKKELRDKEKAKELYLHVKSEVEMSMKYLKEKREKDPYRNLLSRLVYQAIHGFDCEIPTFEL